MASFTSAISNFLNSILNLLTGIFQTFFSAFETVFNAIFRLFRELFDMAEGVVGFVIGNIFILAVIAVGVVVYRRFVMGEKVVVKEKKRV